MMSRMDTSHPLVKTVPVGWIEPLLSWETTLKAAGYSDRTVDTRIRHVRQAARGLGIEAPSDVDSSALLEWCAARTWAPETRHAYYTSLRGFFRHLYQSSDNPALVLPSVRRHSGRPQPIPEQVLAAALRTIHSEREELILLLAAQAGLRAHEIAKLHSRDIFQDLLGYSLRVLGKGGVERYVPLENAFAHRLMAFGAANGNGWLFPGQIGGHLSARWISKLGASLLPDSWTLHKLRHRFATQAFRNGGKDIIAVQKMLGHADLSTTRRYTETDDDALRTAVVGARVSY